MSKKRPSKSDVEKRITDGDHLLCALWNSIPGEHKDAALNLARKYAKVREQARAARRKERVEKRDAGKCQELAATIKKRNAAFDESCEILQRIKDYDREKKTLRLALACLRSQGRVVHFSGGHEIGERVLMDDADGTVCEVVLAEDYPLRVIKYLPTDITLFPPEPEPEKESEPLPSAHSGQRGPVGNDSPDAEADTGREPWATANPIEEYVPGTDYVMGQRVRHKGVVAVVTEYNQDERAGGCTELCIMGQDCSMFDTGATEHICGPEERSAGNFITFKRLDSADES